MNIIKTILQSISIRQLIITTIIIASCALLSIKNTSENLSKLHETSFQNISPFIDRKAFLLDQLNQLNNTPKPLSLRKKFKKTKFPRSQLLFLEKLKHYEPQLNKKITTLSTRQQKKAKPLQHALNSNEKQLQLHLAKYQAHAQAFNTLYNKKSYQLFFKLIPYPKAPEVNPNLLSIKTLIIKS